MYPTISEFLKSFGIDLPLPIQTFGFFVAMAFGVAAWILAIEFRRKQEEGVFSTTTRKVIVGLPAKPADYILSGIIGFLIGFKVLYMALNYSEFVNDPQGTLLSSKGFLAGGIVAAAGLIFWRYRDSKSQELPKPVEKTIIVDARDHVGNIILLGVVGGLVGAKIFHNLENPQEFMRDPVDALLSFSGLTFYGGLIVAAVLIIRYGRKNGLPMFHLTDTAAPALMLCYGIGRIGCQVSGDGDWGIVNLNAKPGWMSFLPDWMWAYKFPHNVNDVGVPIADCVGKWCHELPEPVYPTSFYETVMAVILFLVLWFIRKKIKIPGMLFSIYLVMNGMERFLIESIRVNSLYHIFGMDITQAQIISTLLMITGIVGIWYTRKKARETSHGSIR